MTRHVFFSFKYDPDIWRVNSIRNQVNVKNSQDLGFWDGSISETSYAKNSDYIKQKIRNGLEVTGVTVILVTSSTKNSDYVKYEYEQSVKRNNGILILHVESMKDQYGKTETYGNLPYITKGIEKSWYHQCPIGEWIEDL